ncbi:MAG: ribosome biogenesis GTP-binding protein YihA/YsxC [Nitrospirota bacterium]|nr:ribosome biogenesis GTP-binding protein YihA/YsxC [Nitrospirota bacterium]
MRVTQVEFVTGAVSPAGYPEGELPDVAFSGRSNVGKSSLLNAMVGRKKAIARISSTPGKTREINFYRINERFHLVDLPGYGFARVPQTEKRKWTQRLEEYFTSRPGLRLVVILVDIRHPPSALDHNMVEWVSHLGIPFQVVATKADKLSRNQAQRALGLIRRELGHVPLPVSARDRLGMDTLWKIMEAAL